jgi:uncharacterized cupredoxin-like copper-binding protein
MNRRLRSLVATAVAVPVLLLTGACGAGPGSDLTVPPQPNKDLVEKDPIAGTVRVGLTEWTIVTSAKEVHPGTITLRVTNTGATEHDLVVSGEKGEWRTHVLKPGEQTKLVVKAAKSETLKLWCDEPGHEAQGMHTTLEVLAS